MYPNSLGVFLFAAWPLIIFWLFRKLPVEKALFLSVVISSLFLPSGYEVDYPLIPPLDRHTLTSLTLMFVLYVKKKKNPVFKSGIWTLFFIGYLFSITISTLMNQDVIEYGGVTLQASAPYDVISNIILFVLAFIPFFFGRNLLSDPENNVFMFKTLTILALIYSVPMLYEIRMSPQLHFMTFGYFPGDFLQQMRGDGFRPVVFIGHGLSLAFWFSIASIAALALYKANVEVTKFFGFKVLVYFAVLLVLCKTVSAVVYLIFAAILMYFIKQRKQILISCLIPVFVMLYPINSASQFVKYSEVLDFVSQYSKERKDSLKTRFDNETRLMKRALERPYFGWSGWGRPRVFENGKDITITDGQWIMEFGAYGAVGFVFYYLMLFYPLIVAFKRYRYIEDEKQKIYFSSLAIMLAIGIFDSVPNTGMLPVHLLLGGVLFGQSEFYKRKYLQLRTEKTRKIGD